MNVLENAAGESGSSPNDDLHSCLAFATPTLLEFGGTRRVLAIVPRDSASSAAQATISQQLGVAVTAIAGSDSSLTLCVEADGLSLPHIALDFVERRRDRIEFASRVHCRTDIAWTPLLSTSAPCESSPWPSDHARPTQTQYAMCKTLVL